MHLAVLFALPLALAGPAPGIGWTIYIAYAIPPILVVFVATQTSVRIQDVAGREAPARFKVIRSGGF